MSKIITILSILLFSILAYFVYQNFFISDYQNPNPKDLNIHFFKDSEISLKNIKVKLVYFVPNDRMDSRRENWKKDLKDLSKSLSLFHEAQFRGFSKLSFDIFSDPVIGFRGADFYDGEDTSFGNPNALVSVNDEIKKRLFQKDGDLYSLDFVKSDNDQYVVLGIVYEGVGATGGMETIDKYKQKGDLNRVFLVSSSYLDKEVKNGYTTFYHELLHTFGAPDFYSEKYIYSDDIMGGGRKKPLESTYIDKKLLKDFGMDYLNKDE